MSNKLTLIGLGVNEGDLSVNAFNILNSSDCVLIRTENTVSAKFLKENGIGYIPLDYIYEKSKNFDTLTNNLVKEVKLYLNKGDVCYLADGALAEDRCACRLLQSVKGAKVYEGVSKVQYALLKCGMAPDSYTAVSAYSLKTFERYSFPIVVYDLDSALLASEWKLKLFSVVGEEAEVCLYIDKRQKTMPLYQIDYEDKFDYSTVLIVIEPKLKDKTRFDIYDLMEILRILRRPDGCPWDRVQTPQSIRKNLIEEAYELIDAIDKWDDDKMKEETGDMFMQVAFHTLFAEERGAYELSDVLSGLCEKLITRHTHVFGQDNAKDAQAALAVWNKNKQIEKGYESVTAYVDDVPKCLPALMRAEKMIKRAISSNFDVLTDDELLERIVELLKDRNKLENYCGQLLFYMVYMIKRNGGSPEEALADYLKQFAEQLHVVEDKLNERGVSLKQADGETVKKVYDES